jgi:hypothetical protein
LLTGLKRVFNAIRHRCIQKSGTKVSLFGTPNNRLNNLFKQMFNFGLFFEASCCPIFSMNVVFIPWDCRLCMDERKLLDLTIFLKI